MNDKEVIIEVLKESMKAIKDIFMVGALTLSAVTYIKNVVSTNEPNK